MTETDNPKFKLSDIARATGVPVNTIRSWVQRKYIGLGLTDKQGSDGIAHLLSARTATRVGITGALVKMGLTPRSAFESAKTFTDIGGKNRQSCALFSEGETFLILPGVPDDNRSGARVVNIGRSEKFYEVYLDGTHNSPERGIIAIRLDDIVWSVCSSLGFDPAILGIR